MATPGFGFSVSDVLAGLHVVRKLIRALNNTAGSRSAYQKLISELLNLEEALTGVRGLQVDPAQAAQATQNLKDCAGASRTAMSAQYRGVPDQECKVRKFSRHFPSEFVHLAVQFTQSTVGSMQGNRD